MSRQPLLELKSIVKEFPGVRALDQVIFDLYPGEVHVLVGENGAGKSTLMKVLAGVYQPDAGEIVLEGRQVRLRDPKHAENLGISIIYQEFNLLPYRDVASNIFLGREPVKGPLGKIDYAKMHADSRALLDRVGLSVDTRVLVKDLGVAQQQMVEVAKALSLKAKILIMDEPTAALTSREIANLFSVIKNLVAAGVGIIYISHRLEEIYRIGDRVTVLRDGKYIATLPAADAKMDALVSMMVGREIRNLYTREPVEPGEKVLEVELLTRKGRFENCSIVVRRGEIVGLAGLVGSGRTELARGVFGIDPVDSGEVHVCGSRIAGRSPACSVASGMGLLPEDRKVDGLALIMQVKDNIVQASLKRLFPLGVINFRKELEQANNYVKDLRIATPSVYKQAKFLSGGTQQKVVLAKWLCSGCQVLLFDEPTRGIDVGAKADIYRLMDRLTREGAAILMISSELPELLGMSDRVYVMREGRIVKELNRGDATQEVVISYAMGKGDEYLGSTGTQGR